MYYGRKLQAVYLCTVIIYTFWNSNAVYVVGDLHNIQTFV